MKKKLHIGLMLANALALPLTSLMFTSTLEASAHNVPINPKKLAKATIDDVGVFDYLLSRPPHSGHITGGIYNLPKPVAHEQSSKLPKSANILGYDMLEVYKDSVRLDIKPDTKSTGAILEFQIGNGTAGTVLLRPINGTRNFHVHQIVAGLQASITNQAREIVDDH